MLALKEGELNEKMVCAFFAHTTGTWCYCWKNLKTSMKKLLNHANDKRKQTNRL
jgi:hypothetical protein